MQAPIRRLYVKMAEAYFCVGPIRTVNNAAQVLQVRKSNCAAHTHLVVHEKDASLEVPLHTGFKLGVVSVAI